MLFHVGIEHYADVVPALKSWLTLAEACKPYLGC